MTVSPVHRTMFPYHLPAGCLVQPTTAFSFFSNESDLRRTLFTAMCHASTAAHRELIKRVTDGLNMHGMSTPMVASTASVIKKLAGV